MSSIRFAAALSAFCLITASADAAPPPHGDPALTQQATIHFEQARDAALVARPGRIKEWELERERGGSGLRYSFVIISHGHDFEVGIDARDGAVLENSRESDHPD